MKLTTQNCIDWLTLQIKLNPAIIYGHFDEQEVLDLSLESKNWIRIFKFGAKSKSDYAKNEYWADKLGTNYNRYGDASERYLVPINTIQCIRGFDLKPLEGVLSFIVIETIDGQLHLGEFIGD